jgi:transcriptional regulator GlxA family with amidase domain
MAADAYLADCFARHTPPHVSELASRLCVSPTSLSRNFAADVGAGVSGFLKAAQLARAQALLETTDLSIAVVASSAAFGTRVTFFRAFKRATGLTPEQHRTHAQRVGDVNGILPQEDVH